MDVPMVSLIALLIAIVVSVTTSLNIGTLAIGLSLVVGNYIGGVKIPDIIKGYPTSLFILLAGTTYLFAIAQTNGTLDKITKYAVKAVRGNVAMLPIVLFFLAFGLSAMGPGQITISALLAPPAMLLAGEVGISPLLMALVVGNGAQAGAMSPRGASRDHLGLASREDRHDGCGHGPLDEHAHRACGGFHSRVFPLRRDQTPAHHRHRPAGIAAQPPGGTLQPLPDPDDHRHLRPDRRCRLLQGGYRHGEAS